MTDHKMDFMGDDDGSVDVDMWYTASDHRSMRLVEHTSKYIDDVHEKMRLNPKIVSMRCGEHCTYKFKKSNCLSNGKYCDMLSDPNEKHSYGI